MIDLLILLAATAGPAAPDPLAPAREGKVQCVTPDKAKKTCAAIASYVVHADGSYETVVEAMLAPSPLIVMETHSKGKVEGNAVCGMVLAEDYAKAKLTMNGAPVDEATGAAIQGQLTAALQPLLGKNGCSVARPEGDVEVLEVTMDGVAHPELTQKAIWVKPDEGYKVGA